MALGPLSRCKAVFVALTLIIALIARMSPNRTAAEFSVGAGSLTSVALLIGVARAIQVVLDEGGVVDTMVYAMSLPIQQLPSASVRCRNVLRAEPRQLLHSVGKWPGLCHDADHGAAVGSRGCEPAGSGTWPSSSATGSAIF